MKKLVFFLILLSFNLFVRGQKEDTGHIYISSEILQNIKADIELKIPALKKSLSAQKMTESEIEFTLDTFRIGQIISKRINLNYTTSGMNATLLEAANSYDSLTNKYYKKFLDKLKTEDKEILIETQKAWTSFKNAERKLIGVVNKRTYTGGGTMYSTIAVGSYYNFVKERTIVIFNYYDRILNPY